MGFKWSDAIYSLDSTGSWFMIALFGVILFVFLFSLIKFSKIKQK